MILLGQERNSRDLDGLRLKVAAIITALVAVLSIIYGALRPGDQIPWVGPQGTTTVTVTVTPSVAPSTEPVPPGPVPSTPSVTAAPTDDGR